jgi:hypothetical protein
LALPAQALNAGRPVGLFDQPDDLQLLRGGVSSAWLAVGGWCFFNAGATYAAVRIRAVRNWPRLGTRRIADELNEVAKGEFPFDHHEHLLNGDWEDDLERTSAGETSRSEDADDKTSDDEE